MAGMGGQHQSDYTLTQKKAQNGFLILSEKGEIKKVSAAEINN
jgi:hypothetical protein